MLPPIFVAAHGAASVCGRSENGSTAALHNVLRAMNPILATHKGCAMELFVNPTVRLEPYVQPNSEHPLVDPLSTGNSAGNCGEPVQILDRAIRIQYQIVDIRAGVAEV